MSKIVITPAAALPAAEWVRYLDATGVLPAGAGPGGHARAIAAGKVLAGFVGRAVRVTVDNRPATAVLRCVHGRARQKSYYFEFRAEPFGAEVADTDRDDSRLPAGELEVPTPGVPPGTQEAW